MLRRELRVRWDALGVGRSIKTYRIDDDSRPMQRQLLLITKCIKPQITYPFTVNVSRHITSNFL